MSRVARIIVSVFVKESTTGCFGLTSRMSCASCALMNVDTETNVMTSSMVFSGQLVFGLGCCWVVKPLPSPIDFLLAEVEHALEHGMYYLAIITALTLPDVCSALASENGVTNGGRYREWYRSNLSNRFPNLTDYDCWRLRCGVVHQGRFGRPGMRYSRVIFTIPDQQNNFFHNNIFNDALNLDAVTFCGDIIQGVRDWYESNRDCANVRSNIPHLVQYRPNGLAPYMV